MLGLFGKCLIFSFVLGRGAYLTAICDPVPVITGFTDAARFEGVSLAASIGKS